MSHLLSRACVITEDKREGLTIIPFVSHARITLAILYVGAVGMFENTYNLIFDGDH